MSNLGKSPETPTHHNHNNNSSASQVQRPCSNQDSVSIKDSDTNSATELEPLLPTERDMRLAAARKVLRWQADLASTATEGRHTRARLIVEEADRGDIEWRFPVWDPKSSLPSATNESAPVSPKTVGTLTYEEFCAQADPEPAETSDCEPWACTSADCPHPALLTNSYMSSNEAGSAPDFPEVGHDGNFSFTLDMLTALDQSWGQDEWLYHFPGYLGEVELEDLPDWDPCSCCGNYYCDDCASEDSLG